MCSRSLLTHKFLTQNSLNRSVFHYLLSLSCLSHPVFTFLLLLIGRSWHVGLSGPLIFKQRGLYTEELLNTEAFTQRSFYTEPPLHTEAFTHRRVYHIHTEAFTQRSFYTEHLCTSTLLHRESFTNWRLYTKKRFCTPNPSHTEAFYTEKLLCAESFTQTRIYIEQPLHREAFTRRVVYTQMIAEDFAQSSFYTQTGLHREVFAHTEAVMHRRLCTQKLVHREELAQGSLYTLYLELFTHGNIYTEKLIHRTYLHLRALRRSAGTSMIIYDHLCTYSGYGRYVQWVCQVGTLGTHVPYLYVPYQCTIMYPCAIPCYSHILWRYSGNGAIATYSWNGYMGAWVRINGAHRTYRMPHVLHPCPYLTVAQ